MFDLFCWLVDWLVGWLIWMIWMIKGKEGEGRGGEGREGIVVKLHPLNHPGDLSKRSSFHSSI